MRIKFIATATLLVASTALAPAATILFSLKGFAPAHSSSDTNINIKFALFSSEKSSIDDCVTLGDSGAAFNGTAGTDYQVISSGGNGSGITFNVSSNAITSVKQETSDPSYTVPTVEGKTYTTEDCMAYFLSTGQSSSSNTYAKGSYTVAFGDLYWYGRSDSTYSIDSSSHLGAVQFFTFTLDRDVGANEAVLITFTDESTAKSSLAETSKATTALAVSAQIIPEPSAFGLLAGLGALALAVSRRRKH